VLKPAEEYFLVQSHFLACAAGLSLSPQVLKSSLPAVRNKKPPSLSLLQLAGPGEVFVDCQGDFHTQELGENESLWVSVRCLIGFDGNIQIDWGRSLREVRQPISRRYQEAFLRAIGPGRIAYQTRPGSGGVAI
ncbi:MAG: AIM24 family protein, partial [Pirellulaceae bacterium]